MKGVDYFSTHNESNIKSFEIFLREFASFSAKVGSVTYMKGLSFFIVVSSNVFCLTHN
jgi:hypothetical protein